MRGFTSISDEGVSEVVKTSLISYLNQGFLDLDAYVDVRRPQSGYFGNLHELEWVDHPDYTYGVWAVKRKNLVWEPEGIQISGVWADGVLTSGTINYQGGYVVLDSLPAAVELEYSYRYIDIIDADATDFFRADNEYINHGSGTELPEKRVQTPFIAIEYLGTPSPEGFEIGNTSHWVRPELMFNVFADTPEIAERISNILAAQKDTTFSLFSPSVAAASGITPLNYDGTLNNASGHYNNIKDYTWSKAYNSKIYFKDTAESNHGKVRDGLYHSAVRAKLETVVYL